MSKYDIRQLCEQLSTLDEAGLRDLEMPFIESTDDLLAIVNALTTRQHDYGTCVYAMSLSANAAFNYIAHVLGTTGFQSSCADLDFLKRTRNLEAPFAIINADHMLYPQYNILDEVRGYLDKWLD